MNTRSLFQPSTVIDEFLAAEFAHAQAQIERLRRAQQAMLEHLLAQGLAETDALATLAESKGYRALRRDENFYLSTALRLSKRLEKTPVRHLPEKTEEPASPKENGPLMMPSGPRCEAPRNAPCPCGSGLKYKRCCLGKPLPRAA